MRVTVIGGGVSNEHDVSLRSAAAVADALRQRHEVRTLTIARDGSWWQGDRMLTAGDVADVLRDADVAFPALHGAGGEDGVIQGFLQTLGVAYVGCGVEASAVCMRKDLTKQVLAAHGIDIVEGRVVRDAAGARAAWDQLDGPVVVKPLADGSSVGVQVAHDVETVIEAVRERPKLVERYATGMEVDVGIADLDGVRRTGTPLEIVRPPGSVFDLELKYGGSPPFVLPARLTADQRERVERASLAVFDALGCRGVARVDWFLDADVLRCNEVNTMPGLTAASQLPLMFADVGVPFADLVDGLVRTAARDAA